VAFLSKKLTFTSTRAARPHTAAELTPDGVLAAAVPNGASAPVYAYAPLAAGAFSPGISGTNLVTPQAITEALRTALDRLSPRSRSITLIIPDIAARVFVLDFDSFPTKPVEALAVLRFRLRKMVPFDTEHAAVSHQALAQKSASVKVLVTVMPGPVLAEYEAAVRAAEYEPGVVLPSSLAALAALNPTEAALAANLSGTALTTSITNGDDILLYRTMDLPEDNATRVADVQRNVAVAAAYFEDKLGHRPHQLHYAGAVPARDFARAIDDAELEVIEVAPVPATGASTAIGPIGFAGVTGALAGVA
jgi:type IV pilus assembly protein PilM